MSERCTGGITRTLRAALISNFPDAIELSSIPSLLDTRKGGIYFVGLDETNVAVRMNVPCSSSTQMICISCDRSKSN